MKPLYKCDYCSFTGTEEEVKEHENTHHLIKSKLIKEEQEFLCPISNNSCSYTGCYRYSICEFKEEIRNGVNYGRKSI